MRFTLPVLDASEVFFLASHGADELYCGYLDNGWRKKYGGDASISRRQGEANLSSAEGLKRLCREAEKTGTPVHLTLNGRVTESQIPDLIRIAEYWAEIGGQGIILQDPVLLTLIRHIKPMIYTVSLLAATVNRYAASFWRDLGADRIVLPRFLKIHEMKKIIEAVPEITYEAMVIGDRCPFIDGFCRSVHAESHSPAGPDEEPAETRKSYNPSGCAFHLCMEYGELPQDPCAACCLKELEDNGISIGKAGGRGLPLEIRLRWLDHLQNARNGCSTNQLPALYRNKFGHECNCYYSERE